MPRISKQKASIKSKLDEEIKEKTKFDASKYSNITKGKVAVYVEQIKATLFLDPKKDIQKQIDNYLSRLGIEAKQLINLREKGIIK